MGFVLGDHIPYLAGRLAGMRVLELYCKVTLGSAQCVDKALGYFRRFGAPALLIGRFSTSVRLFASACAGCGHISYRRYLTFDGLGALLYTSVWVLVGSVIGEPAVEFFTRDPRRFTFLGLVLLAFATLVAYRLWRRFRAPSTASESPVAIGQSRGPHTRPGIEQHRVEARSTRADDVHEVRIADIAGLVGRRPRRLEPQGEDARVGLRDADHGGIDHEVEMRAEAGVLQRAAHRAVGVGDDADDAPGLSGPARAPSRPRRRRGGRARSAD